MVGAKLAYRADDSWLPVLPALALTGFIFLGIAVLLWPYRVGVDDRGIWQRHFFRWDLWSREAFASGAVRAGHRPDSWVYPEKPWYSRRLSLNVLAKSERGPLLEWIRQVWRPSTRQLPAEIKISLPLRERLELSGHGILVADDLKGQTRHHPWADVVQVRIERFEHWRWDFCRLEIQFAAATEPVILSHGRRQERRIWDGPDADVVLAFLQQYVDGDRFEVTALAGPPRTHDEADRRLRDMDRSYEGQRKANRFILGALWVGFVVFFTRVARRPTRLGQV